MKKKTEDPDLAQSKTALLRAGRRARELAERTHTLLVTWRDGKLCKEVPAPGSAPASPWTPPSSATVGWQGLSAESLRDASFQDGDPSLRQP